jgi:hypothetical protein
MTFLVQQGESTDPIWVVGASTTVSLGGLVAGALLLKAGAAAIFGLVSVSFLDIHLFTSIITYKIMSTNNEYKKILNIR